MGLDDAFNDSGHRRSPSLCRVQQRIHARDGRTLNLFDHVHIRPCRHRNRAMTQNALHRLSRAIGNCPVAVMRSARWWPSDLPGGGHRSGPLLFQVKAFTPLPARAWVRRTLSPLVWQRWAWWRSRKRAGSPILGAFWVAQRDKDDEDVEYRLGRLRHHLPDRRLRDRRKDRRQHLNLVSGVSYFPCAGLDATSH